VTDFAFCRVRARDATPRGRGPEVGTASRACGDDGGGDDGDHGRTIARRAVVAAVDADDGADAADAARRARRERRWGAHRVIGIGRIERVVGGDAVGVGSHDGDDECASRWVRC